MIFEFGETTKAKEFVGRNPDFIQAFDRVINLTNGCFARTIPIDTEAGRICFDLGQICRRDFVEIVFLGVNGYGAGAMKLLRALYERAVTTTYLTLHPEKAERFRKYTVVHSYKAVQKAQKIAPVELGNMLTDRDLTIKQIVDEYEKVKPEFQQTDCDRCDTKRLASTWDIDFTSMVEKVRSGYEGGVFLIGYTLPNLILHATFLSTQPSRLGPEVAESRDANDAYLAVLTATFLIIQVVLSQNSFFSLGLNADINACMREPFMIPKNDRF